MIAKDAIFKLIQYRRRLESDFDGDMYQLDAEPFDMAVKALEDSEPIFHLQCLRCKGDVGSYSKQTMEQVSYTHYSYCEKCLREGLKLLKEKDNERIL